MTVYHTGDDETKFWTAEYPYDERVGDGVRARKHLEQY
jgi:hypothetical protein